MGGRALAITVALALLGAAAPSPLDQRNRWGRQVNRGSIGGPNSHQAPMIQGAGASLAPTSPRQQLDDVVPRDPAVTSPHASHHSMR